jgi:hypothetical protein
VAGDANRERANEAGILAGTAARATPMSAPDVLQRITTALERAGIAYMLSGSFASAYYGTPRSTQDIDLVIAGSAEQLRAFVQGLPSDRYYADLDAALEAHKRQSLFNVIDLATGWKIDLIIRKSRAFSVQEFSRRQQVNLQNTSLVVASAEDVIIAKLEWSKLARSQRQIQDVAAMLSVRWESLDHPYLEKWIVELGLTKEWGEARRSAGFADQA